MATTASAAAKTAAVPAPVVTSATHLTIAYGSWAKDALVMLDPEVALVVATLYTKFAPAFVQVFYPSSSVSALVDKAFSEAETAIGANALTYDVQSTIVGTVLTWIIQEVPQIEQALLGLAPSVVAELRSLGILPKTS